MSYVPYSSVVGSHMYCMVCTGPDLSYAVNVMSHLMHNPGKDHWDATKWILHCMNFIFDKFECTILMLLVMLTLIMVVILTVGDFWLYLHYLYGCYLLKSILTIYCSFIYY